MGASREYLRNTNLDVIAAEAIVWITFLMAKLRKADRKKNAEMFEAMKSRANLTDPFVFM